MPEEKDNAEKRKGELSLEEQLLALFRGSSTESTDTKTDDKQEVAESPKADSTDTSPNSGEAPPVAPEPPFQHSHTPLGGSPTCPPASELNTLLDGKSQPPPPKAEPSRPVTAGPDVERGQLPFAPMGGPKSSPLAEEITSLFGLPTKRELPPASAPQPLPPLPEPTTKRAAPVPPVPEPGIPPTPAMRSSNGAPVSVGRTSSPSVANGGQDVFRVETLHGPRPGGAFAVLSSLQKRTISLSIEGANLRLLTMSGKSVETWVSTPVDPRFLREGRVANSVGLSEAIAAAMKANNIRGGRLVSAFTSLGSVHRLVSLPQAARKDLSSIIPRELRRANINPENYSVTWQVIPSRTTSFQVFVVGVPAEPLVTFVDALRLAKLKPAAIDIRPLALARAVNQRDAVIAHGESDSLELAVIVDAVPGLMRSIYLGTDATPGIVAARLAEELERTIDFYNGTHRTTPLSPDVPVYVTGEIATYPWLVDTLIAPLGRHVAKLEPPIGLPGDFPVALFMVNIGLLLKQV